MCALQRPEGSLLVEWEGGYQVIQCEACDFATANFAITEAERHVEQTYTTELYNQTFHDDYVAQFEYRKTQIGSERYEYLLGRLASIRRKSRAGCWLRLGSHVGSPPGPRSVLSRARSEPGSRRVLPADGSGRPAW